MKHIGLSNGRVVLITKNNMFLCGKTKHELRVQMHELED